MFIVPNQSIRVKQCGQGRREGGKWETPASFNGRVVCVCVWTVLMESLTHEKIDARACARARERIFAQNDGSIVREHEGFRALRLGRISFAEFSAVLGDRFLSERVLRINMYSNFIGVNFFQYGKNSKFY